MKNLVLGLVLFFAMGGAAKAQTVATIAVADITVSAKSQSKLKTEQDVAQALSDGLLTALKETRKFSILTNEELTARLTDQGLNVQGYYDKSYVGEEFSQVGLDYILTADITAFDTYEQVRGDVEKTLGLMEVDLKLLGVADATSDFDTSASVQLKVTEGGEIEIADAGDQLLALGVEELTERVLVNLFPIRVMKLNDDGSVSLNYGAGLLDVGATVLVYPLDEDALLNEPGTPSGSPIATLQITRTDKKFATAQALGGFDQLEKGQKGLLLGNDG